MSITVDNKSDEGLWKCSCGNHGDSPGSWMTVTDKIPQFPLLIPLSVAGVSISLIILLVLLYYCKKNKHVASASTDLTYAEVRITQGSGERREKPPAVDLIYSTVKKPNNAEKPPAVDLIYSKLKKPNSAEKPPAVDQIYSKLKKPHR
ncbi:hypothetical protein UPYG_G00246670 [Umbra pygmaea]|uniref:Uncharacterized protein n=1 Tax=Umbra pygmaea TaxID=75934 RepID=A0ABD0WLE9_UMBPY